jgi:hypothetical protein
MIPSIVNADRILFTIKAFNAIRKLTKTEVICVISLPRHYRPESLNNR